MDFAKLEADIPNCCRLALAFPGLDMDDALDALSTTPDNADARDQSRSKWGLWRAAHGATPLLDTWLDMQAILDAFPGRIRKAHISRLDPGQIIGVHRDGINRHDEPRNQFKVFNSTLRFHVPLRTNPHAVIRSGDRIYRMAVGECWMLHNMRPHAAANLHETEDRYHLILDIAPNAETMALLDDAETELGEHDEALIARLWPDAIAA